MFSKKSLIFYTVFCSSTLFCMERPNVQRDDDCINIYSQEFECLSECSQTFEDLGAENIPFQKYMVFKKDEDLKFFLQVVAIVHQHRYIELPDKYADILSSKKIEELANFFLASKKYMLKDTEFEKACVLQIRSQAHSLSSEEKESMQKKLSSYRDSFEVFNLKESSQTIPLIIDKGSKMPINGDNQRQFYRTYLTINGSQHRGVAYTYGDGPLQELIFQRNARHYPVKDRMHTKQYVRVIDGDKMRDIEVAKLMTYMKFSRDGRRLVAAAVKNFLPAKFVHDESLHTDPLIYVIDHARDKFVRHHTGSGALLLCGLSPNGEYIATVHQLNGDDELDREFEIRFWDSKNLPVKNDYYFKKDSGKIYWKDDINKPEQSLNKIDTCSGESITELCNLKVANNGHIVLLTGSTIQVFKGSARVKEFSIGEPGRQYGGATIKISDTTDQIVTLMRRTDSETNTITVHSLADGPEAISLDEFNAKDFSIDAPEIDKIKIIHDAKQILGFSKKSLKLWNLNHLGNPVRVIPLESGLYPYKIFWKWNEGMLFGQKEIVHISANNTVKKIKKQNVGCQAGLLRNSPFDISMRSEIQGMFEYTAAYGSVCPHTALERYNIPGRGMVVYSQAEPKNRSLQTITFNYPAKDSLFKSIFEE